jgi:hypothetical protein
VKASFGAQVPGAPDMMQGNKKRTIVDGQLGMAVAAHYDSATKKLNVEKVITDTKKKEALICMVD